MQKPAKHTINSLVNENQHLETDKYISIFDLVEYRPQCELIMGFNLTTNSLFIVPQCPLVSDEGKMNHQAAFSELTHTDRHSLSSTINKFLNGPNMSAFVRAAQLEMDLFERSINRIESFVGSKMLTSNNKNINNDNSGTTNNATVKHTSTITHFSDLVNVDSGNASEGFEATSDEFKSAAESSSSSEDTEKADDDDGDGDDDEPKTTITNSNETADNFQQKRMNGNYK